MWPGGTGRTGLILQTAVLSAAAHCDAGGVFHVYRLSSDGW